MPARFTIIQSNKIKIQYNDIHTTINDIILFDEKFQEKECYKVMLSYQLLHAVYILH